MSKHTLMISAALVGLMAAAPAIAKSELYQITPVSGSTETNIFGVNDSGIATGSWIDASSVEHGYVGPPDGSNYTTFDDPNEPGPGTEPRAINDNGYIAGFGNNSSGSTTSDVPWERVPSGTITEVTKGGTLLNYLVQGLNKSNVFAGGYVNSKSVDVGYEGRNAVYKKNIKIGGIKNSGNAGRAIDDAGDTVGWYLDSSGLQHGLYITGGKPSTIDYTGAVYTVLEGINNKGQISGYYEDSSGILHGFVYTIATQAFKPIKVTGSTSFVQAWEINDMGQVGIGSDAGYYIYCPSAKNCSFGGKRASVPVAQIRKPHLQLP